MCLTVMVVFSLCRVLDHNPLRNLTQDTFLGLPLLTFLWVVLLCVCVCVCVGGGFFLFPWCDRVSVVWGERVDLGVGGISITIKLYFYLLIALHDVLFLSTFFSLSFLNSQGL